MDHATFLRAIIASPADDGPRLVYADWLEEQGEGERAEFIRLQIKMATCRMCHRKDGSERKDSYAANCGRCVPGRERERGLWIDGLLAYAKPADWPELVLHRYQDQVNYTPPTPEAYVRRGFIEALACTWPDWLAHADAIRAAQPVARVRCIGDYDSWRPWLSLDRAVTDVFFSGPVQNWLALQSIQFELENRTDEEGRPILMTARELHQAFLAARWPGIAFELPESRWEPFEHIERVTLPQFVLCETCHAPASYYTIDDRRYQRRDGRAMRLGWCDEHAPVGATAITIVDLAAIASLTSPPAG